MWRVEIDDGVLIRLGWVAAVLCARRSIDPSSIRSADVVPLGELEPLIENRVLGIGSNRAPVARANTSRSLPGEAVVREQFWAVPPGDGEPFNRGPLPVAGGGPGPQEG